MSDEATDYYVWITTRKIRPGTREEFERSWTPPETPEGMVRADVWYAEDEEDEIVGVSLWDSREACERYRSSGVEDERRRAMEPFVVDERSVTYTGRQLSIPGK